MSHIRFQSRPAYADIIVLPGIIKIFTIFSVCELCYISMYNIVHSCYVSRGIHYMTLFLLVRALFQQLYAP